MGGSLMFEEFEIGDIIDNQFEIRKISKGGMGVIFFCFDSENTSPVVIKTFQDKYLSDKNSVNRFEWEANSWVQLEKHRNIVEAYLVKKINGQLFIILEMITGDKLYGATLRGWIEGGGLDLNTILDFSIQFCQGMMHASSKFEEMGKTFVHRDIKPENIMVAADKTLKITDFGLVKAFLDNEKESNLNMGKEFKNEFTALGEICGTLPYMSPEQCLGLEDLDTRSDVYSFGCVLYEMLTGKPPFAENKMHKYIKQHLKKTPKEPNNLHYNIPGKLKIVVMKCLEKERSSRYRNFSEIKETLEEIYFEYTGDRFKEKNSRADLTESDFVNKGYSLSELGKKEEAIRLFDKVLELNPENIYALNNKAEVLSSVGKNSDAVYYCDQAIKIDPGYYWAWYNKGAALMEYSDDKGCSATTYKEEDSLERIKKAIECYDYAIELNPGSERIWLNKGFALIALGNYEQGLKCYDHALQINPDCIYALNNKGTAFAELGKFNEALKYLERAVKISPDYYSAIYNKGAALSALNRQKEAIACYEQLLLQNPQDNAVWLSKGIALSGIGKSEEALKCCEYVLKLNPEMPDALFAKCFFLFNMGCYNEAADTFSTFSQVAPPHYLQKIEELKVVLTGMGYEL
jgi:tetratricopeptide (TPR) repeat protein/tRNA A-37 threonylcarbamoyl transferase component Bud32